MKGEPETLENRMDKLEKVIKGLECRKNAEMRCGNPCEETGNCEYATLIRDPSGEPYYPYICDRKKLCEDAISLIHHQQERIKELEKAQTARVMTLEEVENALDTVVWVEEPEFENFAYHYALIMAYSHKLGFTRVWFAFSAPSVDVEYEYADYGKKWRCWTQRPTDEKRKAVKWE